MKIMTTAKETKQPKSTKHPEQARRPEQANHSKRANPPSGIGRRISAMLLRQISVAAVFFIAATLLHGSGNIKVKACADALGRAIRNDCFTEDSVNAAVSKIRGFISPEPSQDQTSDDTSDENGKNSAVPEITFQ